MPDYKITVFRDGRIKEATQGIITAQNEDEAIEIADEECCEWDWNELDWDADYEYGWELMPSQSQPVSGSTAHTHIVSKTKKP
jgi:hypothetical protein